MSIQHDILLWYATGERGMSSKAMANAVLGIKSDTSHPYDPADLNRCIKFLNMVPEARNHFGKIANMSDTWNKIIKNWSKLEKSFLDEVGYDWSKSKSAPKTYKLMQEIIYGKKRK